MSFVLVFQKWPSIRLFELFHQMGIIRLTDIICLCNTVLGMMYNAIGYGSLPACSLELVGLVVQ